MEDAQRAELTQRLSGVMRRIHRLPSRQVRLIMEIDDRMRRGILEQEDLDFLRSADEEAP